MVEVKSWEPHAAASSEAGQSIVMIAGVLIALLAFVGIAVDTGFAYARASALSAAVDAAALAGATEMHRATGAASVALAQSRADQFMNANGWPMAQAITRTSAISITTNGLPQYQLTVEWPVRLFFLRVIGFDDITIQRSASASFYAQSDLLTTTAAEDGVVRKASLFNFGDAACTRHGDALGPRMTTATEPNALHASTDGAYTYRIRIPEDYITDTATSLLRIELFDPDGYNNPNPSNTAVVNHSKSAVAGGAAATESLSCAGGPGIGEQCIVDTTETATNLHQNPLWYVRVDESWTAGCPAGPDAGGTSLNNETRYELYFYNAAGNRTKITAYTARILNGPLTDLKWVLPGIDAGTPTDNGSDFEVDINLLPLDSYGFRYLYLEVTGSNSSKNVWDIWAGPPALSNALPDNVNDRNVFLVDRRYDLAVNPTTTSPLPDDGGVRVYAVGRMPLETHVDGQVSLPLANVDASRGNSSIYASIFDLDAIQSGPINFTINTVSTSDFNMNFAIVNLSPDISLNQMACNNSSVCDNAWLTPQARIGVPSIDGTPSVAFFGGDLYVNYTVANDAHTWSLSITDGRPFLTR